MKKEKGIWCRRWVAVLLFMVVIAAVPAAASYSLKKTTLTLKKGNVYVLRLNGNSEGAEVTWKTSAKKKAALVSKKHNRVVIRAKATGNAVITAKIGTEKLTCKVKVVKNEKYPAKLTLCVGDTFTFSTAKRCGWELSNQKGALKTASSGKKATFTAKKKGSVKVIASKGKKSYSCTVKIIRKDGATKADLAEEKAISEEKESETETGDPTPEAVEASQVPLTDAMKYMMTGLAQSAVKRQKDTDYIYECNIHSMDLDASTMAFMIYQYIYHHASWKTDTEADQSIEEITLNEMPYNAVGDDALKALATHLFGEEDHTLALQKIKTDYVAHVQGNSYLIETFGDFGDPGSSYFTGADQVTTSYQMYCLSGRVMTWKNDTVGYVHTHNYKAYWAVKRAARANGGYDTWFQFDHVEVYYP